VIELPPGHPCLSADELNRLIRQQSLGHQIAQAMIVDQIVHSVQLDEQESGRLVDSYLADRGISDQDARASYLEVESISEDDLLWRATTARRLEIHRQQHHGPDVESHFLDRKLHLDQVTYSLIRVRDADLAAEIYQQIREGEADFQQLAPMFAEGQERHSGGLIGPVPLGAAHPDLISRLRTGELRQLWEPIFVVDIWVVLRLEQRITAQLDEAMRVQLEQELFERWFLERVRAVLAGETLSPLSVAAS
jgi:parvulin-like peptidyl-prolyl isomerase